MVHELHRLGAMRATWVTCPETAHLERIEFLRTPLGRLVRACSRFPGCRMMCPRTCVARLDQRDRAAAGEAEPADALPRVEVGPAGDTPRVE